MAKPEIGTTGWGTVLNDHLTGMETDIAAKADASAIPTTPEEVGAEPAGLSATTEAALSATYAPKAVETLVSLPQRAGLTVTTEDAAPTVTVTAYDGDTSIVGGSVIFPFDPASYTADGNTVGQDERFVFLGCTPQVVRGAASGDFIYSAQNHLTDGSRQKNITVSFMHDGDTLEVLEWGYNNVVRIIVDGKIVTSGTQGWTATAADGLLYRRKLAFADRRHREVIVQVSESQFPGIGIGATDGFYAPPMAGVPRAIALGDSVTVGQNNNLSRLAIWTTYLSGALGWDVWDAGQGGTGYLNPGPHASHSVFENRIATDVAPYSPDYLIVAGGLNDQTSVNPAYTSAARQAAIQSLIDAAALEVPDTQLIILGPFLSMEGSAGEQAVHDDLETVCAANPGVIFIPTTGLITGTGNAAAPTGTGNADVYISNDDVHPTAAGHEAWARLIAGRLVPLLTA